MIVTIATFEKRSPPSAIEREGSMIQVKYINDHGGNARRKKNFLAMVLL
jgi:hypothetical protein